MKELEQDTLVANEHLTSTDESKEGETLGLEIKMHMKADALSQIAADSEIQALEEQNKETQ